MQRKHIILLAFFVVIAISSTIVYLSINAQPVLSPEPDIEEERKIVPVPNDKPWWVYKYPVRMKHVIGTAPTFELAKKQCLDNDKCTHVNNLNALGMGVVEDPTSQSTVYSKGTMIGTANWKHMGKVTYTQFPPDQTTSFKLYEYYSNHKYHYKVSGIAGIFNFISLNKPLRKNTEIKPEDLALPPQVYLQYSYAPPYKSNFVVHIS